LVAVTGWNSAIATLDKRLWMERMSALTVRIEVRIDKKARDNYVVTTAPDINWLESVKPPAM